MTVRWSRGGGLGPAEAAVAEEGTTFRLSAGFSEVRRENRGTWGILRLPAGLASTSTGRAWRAVPCSPYWEVIAVAFCPRCDGSAWWSERYDPTFRDGRVLPAPAPPRFECRNPDGPPMTLDEQPAGCGFSVEAPTFEGWDAEWRSVLDGVERPRPELVLTVEDVARVTHEVNRACCLAVGDDSQPPWEEAPGWQRESAANGVRLHLEHPEAGPEASHEAWMAEKYAKGWRWGSVKDAEERTHPCLVPFSALPVEQRAKDHVFRAVVLALARHLP